MATISDLIEAALESEDREAPYRAFHAILTCVNPEELLAAISVADPIFKLAINARLDQLALDDLLENVLPYTQKVADDLIADRKARSPKSSPSRTLG